MMGSPMGSPQSSSMVVRKDGQVLYAGVSSQALHSNYGMITPTYPQHTPQQSVQYHRQPMATWNPPVYQQEQQQQQQQHPWGTPQTPQTPQQQQQHFKQESFKVEPQDSVDQPVHNQYGQQHNTENQHPGQQQEQEFSHLFSPLKYLNDFDTEAHYHSLGVAPLPLHGQVRPVKVEPEWSNEPANESQHPSNLTSTPPILRRRGRKREVEEEKLDQVSLKLPLIIQSHQQETAIDVCSITVHVFNGSTHLDEMKFHSSFGSMKEIVLCLLTNHQPLYFGARM